MNRSIDPQFIGRNVQALREQRGWSQKELAERAKLAQSQVSLIERGEANPTIESLNKISTALGVAAIILLLGIALAAMLETSSSQS